MSDWIDVKQIMPPEDSTVDIWCVWTATGIGSRIPDANYRSDSFGPYWSFRHGHIDENVIKYWRFPPAPPETT